MEDGCGGMTVVGCGQMAVGIFCVFVCVCLCVHVVCMDGEYEWCIQKRSGCNW